MFRHLGTLFIHELQLSQERQQQSPAEKWHCDKWFMWLPSVIDWFCVTNAPAQGCRLEIVIVFISYSQICHIVFGVPLQFYLNSISHMLFRLNKHCETDNQDESLCEICATCDGIMWCMNIWSCLIHCPLVMFDILLSLCSMFMPVLLDLPFKKSLGGLSKGKILMGGVSLSFVSICRCVMRSSL